MISFMGGPADGLTMLLRAAPELLRVTYDPKRKHWDALDQPSDQPSMTEEIHVYHLVENKGGVHIRACKPAASGFFKIAAYCYVPAPPPIEVLRSTRKWFQWVAAQV